MIINWKQVSNRYFVCAGHFSIKKVVREGKQWVLYSVAKKKYYCFETLEGAFIGANNIGLDQREGNESWTKGKSFSEMTGF